VSVPHVAGNLREALDYAIGPTPRNTAVWADDRLERALAASRFEPAVRCDVLAFRWHSDSSAQLLVDARSILPSGTTLAAVCVQPVSGAAALLQGAARLVKAQRQSISLSTVCGAMLAGGVTDLRVVRADGWRGETLVVGRLT
jgi:hypothetical protein